MDMTKDIIDFTTTPTTTTNLHELNNSSRSYAADSTATATHDDDDAQMARVGCLTPPPAKVSTRAPSPHTAISERSIANACSPTAATPQATAAAIAADDDDDHFMFSKATSKQMTGNMFSSGGDISPPPRPLTTSAVIGLTSSPDDEYLDMATTPKSHSLPASPNHHLAASTVAALLEFGQRNVVATSAANAKAAAVKLTKPMPTHRLREGAATPLPPLHCSKATKIATATSSQQFCLRWNNYQSNLTNVFDELLQNESFVDVTLACEGQSIKAHKMVLSACSPYFQALFYDNPCQHPIVIMRDVRWQELKAIMEFMYKGEINVSQDQINPLLKVAEMLKIRGLAEVNAGTGGAHGMAAAHPMLPEQRMTVYDDEDDEDDDEIMRAAHILAEDADNDDELRRKPKRARILEKLTTTTTTASNAGHALDVNLTIQRQRKRSRDGLLLEERFIAPRSRSVTPQAHHINDMTMSPPPPIAMTTSTIVRNPFASPNPQQQQTLTSASGGGAPSNTNSNTSASSCAAGIGAGSVVGNGGVGSGTSNSSSSSSHHSTPSTYRPALSCSPTPAHNNNNNNNNGSLASPVTASTAVGRDNNAAAHQLAATHSHHHHAAAAAAALANSSYPHHSHHQLAAQHQLHAAAHSHAAMASALGASLAAAAAGVGSASGGGGNGGVGMPNAAAIASHHDDLEIKPEIAEMIREEERAKMIEGGHPWMGGASTSSVADSYQYQLQSMWQKCWNTNQQNLVQQLRFRERGPLKSWRPEAMAEAIFSVLKEGLSLSQAARKYDIPYPTFVLYANRVHNMLGPSLDGGTDPRPKARGRPQRILLGMWPEELIRSVIKAVVFRDYREIKEELGHAYANGQAHAQSPFGTPGNPGAANGYHSAAKLAAQNAALAPPDSASPLSTMTETLRRQIMSQQQQSPLSQTMNMYKSPAYLQRSEIEDQVSAAAAAAVKQQSERGSRGGAADNMPDLSALGLMSMGLNVMPSAAQQRSSQMHPSAVAYSRERERERERELKEAMQARQYGNDSRGSASGSAVHKQPGSVPPPTSGTVSPFQHFKSKDHPNYAYNKRFLESLPPGIDFEAIANGLLQQKTINKSPRFEDFFPGQDVNELFANTEAAAAAVAGAAYPTVRETPLMKIKLEHQAAEMSHED